MESILHKAQTFFYNCDLNICFSKENLFSMHKLIFSKLLSKQINFNLNSAMIYKSVLSFFQKRKKRKGKT